MLRTYCKYCGVSVEENLLVDTAPAYCSSLYFLFAIFTVIFVFASDALASKATADINHNYSGSARVPPALKSVEWDNCWLRPTVYSVLLSDIMWHDRWLNASTSSDVERNWIKACFYFSENGVSSIMLFHRCQCIFNAHRTLTGIIRSQHIWVKTWGDTELHWLKAHPSNSLCDLVQSTKTHPTDSTVILYSSVEDHCIYISSSWPLTTKRRMCLSTRDICFLKCCWDFCTFNRAGLFVDWLIRLRLSLSCQTVHQPCFCLKRPAATLDCCHRSNCCHGDQGEDGRRDGQRTREDTCCSVQWMVNGLHL